MTYAGETTKKKMARDVFWTLVMDHAPELLVDDGHVMVLASRDCGDVSWLRSVDLDPSRIVAVDVDHGAIEACDRRFPEATTHLGDFNDAAQRFRGNVSVAFLDLCSNVSLALVRALKSFVARAFRGRERSILGVGFMRGREGFDGKSIRRRGARMVDAMGLTDAQRDGRAYGSVVVKEIETDRAFGLRAALNDAVSRASARHRRLPGQANADAIRPL